MEVDVVVEMRDERKREKVRSEREKIERTNNENSE